jgi:hypothetical protein
MQQGGNEVSKKYPFLPVFVQYPLAFNIFLPIKLQLNYNETSTKRQPNENLKDILF